MCSRATIAAVLLFVTAVPVRGQQTALELQRRIDSLAPLVEQAAVEAELARIEALEQARLSAATRLSLDTLQIAGMRIIAPLSDTEQARELFGEVLAEGLPGVENGSLAGRTFTYQRASYAVEEILVEGTGHRVVVPLWHSRARSKEHIRTALGVALTADLAETRLGTWMRSNPFAPRDPAVLYREVVVARSQSVGRCLDGDVESCTVSLGLDLGDDVLDVWYTPEQRRVRVLQWASYGAPAGDGAIPTRFTRLYGPAFESCVRLLTPDACDVYMRAEPDSWTPLPTHMRASLASLALQRGGPGAWTRLIEDPTMSPEDALSYSAGIPLDDLVAEWRTWIGTNRPEAYAGIGGKSGLALLWFVFFAALATRSTRWRFA